MELDDTQTMPDSEYLSLPVAGLDRLCDALAAGPSWPQAMAEIDAARRGWIGSGILSVNVNLDAPERRPGEVLLQRIWTSDPASYPVGGRKHKRMTSWTRTLTVDLNVCQTAGRAAMAETFDDHALMASVGVQAVVNVPIVGNDKLCVAILNFMGAQPAYGAAQVAALRLLAGLARPWICAEADKVSYLVSSPAAA